MQLDAYIKGVGMIDRSKLESRIWGVLPSEMKITASGAKWVMVGGKLTPMAALSTDALFALRSRVLVAKTIINAVEAA